MDKNNTPAQYVDIFFKKIGIGGQIKPDHFWKQLEKKYGRKAVDFADIVEDRENGKKVDVYSIKNHSIDFANSIASQFDSSKLRSIAKALLNFSFEDGSSFLEVGCDNGILLCLLASYYKKVNFTGIDSCEEAINLATIRANNLGLNNVKFVHHVLDENLSAKLITHYDFILTVAVFHEIFETWLDKKNYGVIDPKLQGFSATEIQNLSSARLEIIPCLIELKKLLTEDGVIISVDRWSAFSIALQFVRLVEFHGFEVSLNESSLIKYQDFDRHTQTLPMTIYFQSNQSSVDPEDLLAFFSSDYFFKDAAFLTKIENDYIAELLYSGLDKIVIYEQESVFNNGTGTERLEVGVSKGLGYEYTTTNQGYRRLAIFPAFFMPERVSIIEAFKKNRELGCQVSFKWLNKDIFKRLKLSIN